MDLDRGLPAPGIAVHAGVARVSARSSWAWPGFSPSPPPRSWRSGRGRGSAGATSARPRGPARRTGRWPRAFGVNRRRLALLLAGLSTAYAAVAGLFIALNHTLAPVADLLVDRRRLRRRDHRPARQRLRPARRLACSSPQRGGDDGGDGAGLGAAGLLHALILILLLPASSCEPNAASARARSGPGGRRSRCALVPALKLPRLLRDVPVYLVCFWRRWPRAGTSSAATPATSASATPRSSGGRLHHRDPDDRRSASPSCGRLPTAGLVAALLGRRHRRGWSFASAACGASSSAS